MMSLRSVARSLPRSITRLSKPATQSPFTISHRASPFKPCLIASSRPRFAAAFSTSASRKDDSPEIDQEIAIKLSEEMAMEKGPKPVESMPEELQAYLDDCPFTIEDSQGSKAVVLSREFGSEKITVTFSTDDVNAMSEQANDDAALYDDEVSDEELAAGGSGTSVASKGAGRPPVESDGAEAGEEAGEEDLTPSITVELEVIVKKKGSGALRIDAVAEDGTLSISNFEYFTPEGEKVALAPHTAAAVGQALPYSGPQFQSLDEDLQLMFERYLETRGVDIKLAMFAPVYVEWKEQQEYLRWLENVKGFIEA